MTSTIPAIVERAAAEFGDDEALVDGDLRLSFAELAERIGNAGRAFVTAGLQPGERVAIWAPNIAEWVIAGLGVHLAGGVLVPLNTRFKGAEAADIIARSGARLLLTVDGFLGLDYVGMLAGAAVPELRDIVVLRGETPPGTRGWDDFTAAGDPGAALPTVGADDLSDLIFTSGTTGRPKGVMTTHYQSARVFETWADVVGLRRGDRYLIVMPFFHTFGYKAGILACLLRGATIVPLPVFDVPTALETVQRERISVLPGSPTLYLSILDHPDRTRYDLSSLRLAVTGAAHVPVEMLRRMRDELTFGTILTAYGLSESSGTVTMCRRDDDEETVSRTSGRAIPDVEVRIVDDANREVPRGEAGEIVCRGYNVMRGYFADPEATAKAIDARGWLHTGDIGTMDERGYVTITDRKKDMFICGGFNAYPAEIEGVLLAHPGIAQVAVVGVPDARQGEVGHAFVVPRHGASVDPAEVIAWSRPRMANFKVPAAVHVVEALPLNAAGKVQKFLLREQASTT